MFDLNNLMEVQNEKDFITIRKQFSLWKKRFPMFDHDVRQIERIIEQHIKNHSISMVKYRQTHSRAHLDDAQQEINEINRVLSTVGKLELMALLSQG